MKKPRLAKKFLEELKSIPNVSVVCKKLNLSRQTIYRWQSEDAEFKEALDEAIDVGRDAITDLAENKLISNINDGDPRSIEYWLTNNARRYYKPKAPLPPPPAEKPQPTHFHIHLNKKEIANYEVPIKPKVRPESSIPPSDANPT